MEIKIRKATTADVESFYKMGIELNKYNEEISHNHEEFFPEGWEKEFYRQSLEAVTKPNHAVYIVSIDGVDAGYGHWYTCEDCNYSKLDELFILKDFRKLGLGKLLVDEFIKWSTKYDFPLSVEVYNWNPQAIEFYKKMGFNLTTVALEMPNKNK